MSKTSVRNGAMTVLLSICLGAVVGLVLWLFLRAIALGSRFIWQLIPEYAGHKWIMIPVCALGGLIVGILHRIYGDYPESLNAVMGKVKKDKHYDYHPMLVMLICALIPLIFGSSVGPEAGLTGIIAALCYWIGDNVTYAKNNASLYSEIGEAVTLGQIFHMPLFGILAVDEESETEDKGPALPKLHKLVLYTLSAAASFLVISGLNGLFNTSLEGFPSFSDVTISGTDYIFALVYIFVGVLLYCLYTGAEKITEKISHFIPVILREVICGVVIGAMGLCVPIVMFSGEEQMAELMGTYASYAPVFLIGICLLKIVMTAFCLSFGMKGGHFFPLIFACVCMGFAISMLVFPDPAGHLVFAAGVVTSATLGAQLKKPMAVSVLMLLCFPVRLLLWIFLAAVIGGRIAELIDRKNKLS